MIRRERCDHKSDVHSFAIRVWKSWNCGMLFVDISTIYAGSLDADKDSRPIWVDLQAEECQDHGQDMQDQGIEDRNLVVADPLLRCLSPPFSEQQRYCYPSEVRQRSRYM